MPVAEASRPEAPARTSAWLESTWLEPVLLGRAFRRAHALSPEARERMRPWALAARARFDVARELRDFETQYVALALLADAAFLTLCALEAADADGAPVSRSAAEAWARFVAPADAPPELAEPLALVRAAFGSGDPLAVDRVEPRLANELRLAAEASVAWLSTLAEIRTTAELSRARFVRSAFTVLGIASCVVLLAAYVLSLGALEPR